MKKLCLIISLLSVPCFGMERKRPNEGKINSRAKKRKKRSPEQRLLNELEGLKSDLQQLVNQLFHELSRQELCVLVETIIQKEPDKSIKELKALLDCDLNPNLQNEKQQTIMYKVVEECEDPTQLLALLFEYSANPNIGDYDRETPLLHATQYPNDSNTIKLLVDNGAYIDAFDALRRTPILVLVANLENEQAGINIIKYMLSRGTLSNFDLKTEKPLNNGSKLHIVTKKLKEITDLLTVKMNHDINNYSGMNASQIAKAKGFNNLAQYLDPDDFIMHLGQNISTYIDNYYKK